MDTLWFHDQIRRSHHKSLRGLAKKMTGRHGRTMSIRAMSEMLSGKREMRLDEARQLAELLQIPLIDVLRHTGLPL